MVAEHSDLIAPAQFSNVPPTSFVDAMAQPPPKYTYTEERPQTRGTRAGQSRGSGTAGGSRGGMR